MFICKCKCFDQNFFISCIQHQVSAVKVRKKSKITKSQKNYFLNNLTTMQGIVMPIARWITISKKMKQILYLSFKFFYFIFKHHFYLKKLINLWKSRNNWDDNITLEIYEFVERIKTAKRCLCFIITSKSKEIIRLLER